MSDRTARNRLHSQFGGAFTINATAVFDYPTIGGPPNIWWPNRRMGRGDRGGDPPETPRTRESDVAGPPARGTTPLAEPGESDVAGPPARGTTPLAEPGEQGAESSD